MCTLDRIIKLIKEKGVTQQEFLKSIDLNKSALSDWKKGVNSSYKKHIEKIADYFNVTTDYLLCKSDIPNPATDEQYSELLKGLNRLTPEQIKQVRSYVDFIASQKNSK